MRWLHLAAVFLAGACGTPLTGVDRASVTDDAAAVAKKGGKRGGSDRGEPVICIELAEGGECPDIPVGPFIGL